MNIKITIHPLKDLQIFLLGFWTLFTNTNQIQNKSFY